MQLLHLYGSTRSMSCPPSLTVIALPVEEARFAATRYASLVVFGRIASTAQIGLGIEHRFSLVRMNRVLGLVTDVNSTHLNGMEQTFLGWLIQITRRL